MAEQFDAKGIEESLAKPIAGVPGYVWVVGGAAGVFIVWWRRRKSAASNPAAGASDSNNLPGGDATTPNPVFVPNNSTAGSISSTSTGPNPLITSNDDWVSAAERELVAEGYDPATVDNALRKYVGQVQLTANEGALIAKALQKIGPPPTPIPFAVSSPTTPRIQPPTPTPTPIPHPVTTPPPPAPAPIPSVTIKSGDTLWNLVRVHYGHVDTGLVTKVAAYNGLHWDASHTHVSPWFAGQIVKFPAA